MSFVILWTDALLFLLIFAGIAVALWMRQYEHWRSPWAEVGRRRLGMAALVFLCAYMAIGILDSIHFRTSKSSTIISVFDKLIKPLGENEEKTYSAPFSLVSYSKSSAMINGAQKPFYPRLKHAGLHLDSFKDRRKDILLKTLQGVGFGLLLWLLTASVVIVGLALKHKTRMTDMLTKIVKGKTFIAWREMLIAIAIVIVFASFIKHLSPYYHIYGTDKVGHDVLYESLKSIRTGLIIGTLTTLVMLPFAILLGTQAGYFGGWIDDIIQYVYTTLSSIPGVLLISAAVLSLQIFIANQPWLFPNLESRADARLLALCMILGITSWTSLCRLLRGETLKLKEADFVRAAVALGVKNFKIISRHILPNLMHIILITTVIDFSGLVLAEAVLSYVGVGVDPTTFSWGNMINSARLDLAREPLVWWPLLAAFNFMFVLVLAANLFADAVRDAFDPRLRNGT